MSESKNKNHSYISKILLFALFLALIWTSIVCVKTIYKKHQMIRESDVIKAEIIALRGQNEELRKLKGLFGSRDFLEKEAKRRLNLKKEGEEVVVVGESGAESATLDNIISGTTLEEDEENVSARKEISNPQKWKLYFLKTNN